MNWKRIAPWNWFKEEDTSAGAVPQSRNSASDAFAALHAELERVLGPAWRRLPGESEFASMPGAIQGLLRPNIDISEGKRAYTVQAELPGVEIADLSIEVDGHTLTIRGDKRQEREGDDEGYHCIERSYGSVQRVLSLPDDADIEAIDAKFRNGVLRLRIPRRAASTSSSRNIEIEVD
ncbi:MAG: Hsp20/alpha crystallin family protein [Deltaproteobacteria bacterium]|nr:Hsp20/alpha crystallin family protein [Deltaproteobacteria bacterium]MBW2360922.1 Hsp20/alpha crystallin family protein [Deltaproteobacteria bacterium]